MSQHLGKDIVLQTWVDPSGNKLHHTTAGYQLGEGKDRHVITDVNEVTEFGAEPVRMVTEWLKRGGPVEARKSILNQEVSERAVAQPGVLDAMAAKLGPECQQKIFEVLDSALRQAIGEKPDVHEKGTPSDLPILQSPVIDEHKVDGGSIVTHENGVRQFVPGDDLDIAEDDSELEKALIAAQEAKRGGGKRK
jgi:hypothetical protein